jgi:hypothetical protein
MKENVVVRYGLSTVSAAALSLALLGSPLAAQGFSDAAAANLAKLGVQTPPVESLTTEQVAEITNILASSDPDNLKKQHIHTVLGNEASPVTSGRLGARQLRDSATSDLAGLGIDASAVDTLTISQLGQIENVMAGPDAQDVKKLRVQEIIAGEATATGRLGVTQLQDSAVSELASIGVDADGIETLTVSQLGQIENVMGSSASDDSKRDQVNKIIGRVTPDD